MIENKYPNPPSHEWVCKKCGAAKMIQANDPNTTCICGGPMYPDQLTEGE
jgi:hypothetical protein